MGDICLVCHDFNSSVLESKTKTIWDDDVSYQGRQNSREKMNHREGPQTPKNPNAKTGMFETDLFQTLALIRQRRWSELKWRCSSKDFEHRLLPAFLGSWEFLGSASRRSSYFSPLIQTIAPIRAIKCWKRACYLVVFESFLCSENYLVIHYLFRYISMTDDLKNVADSWEELLEDEVWKCGIFLSSISSWQKPSKEFAFRFLRRASTLSAATAARLLKKRNVSTVSQLSKSWYYFACLGYRHLAILSGTPIGTEDVLYKLRRDFGDGVRLKKVDDSNCIIIFSNAIDGRSSRLIFLIFDHLQPEMPSKTPTSFYRCVFMISTILIFNNT